MAKKVQVPVVGGIRKVVSVDAAAAAAGTTIAEFGATVVTLAQLKAALGIVTKPNTVGGASAGGALVVGPGLSGGGQIAGAVPLNLIAPIPFMTGDDGGGGGDGDPGPPGLPGAAGATGAQGPAGPAVLFIDEGPEGEQGFPGAPGPAGGPPGPAGATGAVGPVGPIIWLPGEDGADGDMGPPGLQGPAGSGTTIAVPGTIPDLAWWWESDNILGLNGGNVFGAQDRTPWVGIGAPCGSAAFPTLITNALNGLPAVQFTSAGTYFTIPGSGVLKTVTIFSVFNSSVPSGPDSIIGTVSGSGIILRIWSNHMNVLVDLVGGGGSSTATVTANTWYQGNVTYDTTAGGAFAFRQSRTAAGSGTGAATPSQPMNQIGGGGSGENLRGMLAAVIVYSRVLTNTEITTVENYLNAKWGV